MSHVEAWAAGTAVRSARRAGAPWYAGPTLLELLETVPVIVADGPALRLPVQLVVRPGLGYRGFAGQLAAGGLAVGDEIAVLPSGRRTRVDVERLVAVIDPETLTEAPTARLELNDLGRVVLRAHRPLFVDAYARCRATGAFILIDALSHDTVAAGMIDPPRADDAPGVERVTAVDRRARLGQAGAVVELGGGDAIGRAFALERALFEAGRIAIVVAAEHATAIAAAAVIAIVPRADRPDGATIDGAAVDGDLTRAVLIAAGKLDAGRADRR